MSVLKAALERADTTELAQTATVMVGRCQATGLTPSSYRAVIAVAVTLGMTAAPRQAAWPNDIAFANAIVELEDELAASLGLVNTMITKYARELRLIDDESQSFVDALEAALEVLHATAKRLHYALTRLMTATDELGEVYAAAYKHVRSGRKLPHNGRFLTESSM